MMRVVIRVDAGTAMGMGHVMRCITLAKCCMVKGAEVFFFANDLAARAITEHCSGAPCILIPAGLNEPRDAQYCAQLLETMDADWMVVDHYDLGADWETAIRSADIQILAIDDLGRRHCADILTDSAIEAASRYAFTDAPIQLLGADYALLRSSFAVLREQRNAQRTMRLSICFGGSDPLNMTGFCVETLAGHVPDVLSVDVIVGGGYAHYEAIKKRCDALDWQLHRDHRAPETIFLHSRLAIGAGGTMNWERCALGVPSLVITIAENQQAQTQALHDIGALYFLGKAGAVTAAALREKVAQFLHDSGQMSEVARQQVDGLGAPRVVAAMQEKL